MFRVKYILKVSNKEECFDGLNMIQWKECSSLLVSNVYLGNTDKWQVGPSDLWAAPRQGEIIDRLFVVGYELRVVIKFSVGKMSLDFELVIKMATKGSRSFDVKGACIIRFC